MLEEKRNYLIGVRSNSSIYPDVEYFGTLRGAKMYATRYYGPAIYKGEYLLIMNDSEGDNFVCEKHEDGWRE